MNNDALKKTAVLSMVAIMNKWRVALAKITGQMIFKCWFTQ